MTKRSRNPTRNVFERSMKGSAAARTSCARARASCVGDLSIHFASLGLHRRARDQAGARPCSASSTRSAKRRLDRLDVLGPRSLRTLAFVERDALALLEVLEA